MLMESNMEIILYTILFLLISLFIIVYVSFKHDPWLDDYNEFIDIEKTLDEIEQLAEEFKETTKRG